LEIAYERVPELFLPRQKLRRSSIELSGRLRFKPSEKETYWLRAEGFATITFRVVRDLAGC
jgi:hypothetical protein